MPDPNYGGGVVDIFAGPFTILLKKKSDQNDGSVSINIESYEALNDELSFGIARSYRHCIDFRL